MTKLIDITGKALSGEWGSDDETGNGIPVLRTTNFTNDGVVNYEDIVTRIVNKKNIEHKYLRRGDIIIEKSGGSDKQPVGRVIFFDGPENTYLFNNFTGLLRVQDTSAWYPKYVFYSLYSNYRRGETRPFENKTTGLHNLKTDDYVSRCDVNEADLHMQVEICNHLDKLYTVIQKRKQELQLLEELIKARFVEMFGDFIRKSEPINFKSICEFVTVGIANSATHAFCDEGVVMFRNQNIKEDYLDSSDIVYITSDFASKYKSKMLKKDDLLVVRTGYPGVACLVPEQYEGCQTFTTLIARIKRCSKINPRFVCHYINSEFGKRYVRDNSAGAAQQNFGATALSKLPMCLPDIEVQNEYINFVNHIDKLKVKVQQSLDETQTLFDSLMQQYFG